MSETEELKQVVEDDRPVQRPIAIAVDPKTHGMVAHDNSQLMRIIKQMMKGMAFPKTLDTEEKIIAAWQVAASLKIPPAVAMQNMAIINGSVCIWGQLPKALAEATGELTDFKLFYLDDKYNKISMEHKNLDAPIEYAVVQIQRGSRTLNEYTFSMKEAKDAGLLGKAGPWKIYPKIMLARRAMGHAIKFEFPDAVMGVGIAEYDHHEAPDIADIKDVTPRTVGGKAEALNNTIKDIEK